MWFILVENRLLCFPSDLSEPVNIRGIHAHFTAPVSNFFQRLEGREILSMAGRDISDQS